MSSNEHHEQQYYGKKHIVKKRKCTKEDEEFEKQELDELETESFQHVHPSELKKEGEKGGK